MSMLPVNEFKNTSNDNLVSCKMRCTKYFLKSNFNSIPYKKRHKQPLKM